MRFSSVVWLTWLMWLMWLIFLRMFSLICAAGTEVTVVENAVPTVLFQGHTFLCGTHVIHCLVWAPPCGRVKSVKTETCVDLFLAVVRETGSTSYSVVVVGFFLFFFNVCNTVCQSRLDTCPLCWCWLWENNKHVRNNSSAFLLLDSEQSLPLILFFYWKLILIQSQTNITARWGG